MMKEVRINRVGEPDLWLRYVEDKIFVFGVNQDVEEITKAEENGYLNSLVIDDDEN